MKSIIKKIARLQSQIAKEREKLLLYEEQRTKHINDVFHGGTDYVQYLAQKELNKLRPLIKKAKARIEEKEKALSILLSDEKTQEEITQEILSHEEVTQSEVTTIEEIIQAQVENNQEKPIQEIEESIQESQATIEYSLKEYIESIIPIEHITTQELNDNVVFSFSIKKSDLMAFKAPKVYNSYEHSIKVKKGQAKAREKGIKPGLKKGSKRQRKDKQLIIDQIKSLSNSFNGDKNNRELSKILHCSLNRICDYKREIKHQLEKSQLNLFTE